MTYVVNCQTFFFLRKISPKIVDHRTGPGGAKINVSYSIVLHYFSRNFIGLEQIQDGICISTSLLGRKLPSLHRFVLNYDGLPTFSI